MFKEPKIIFHHVPKCGGTSIVTGLALTYYPLRLMRYGKRGFPGVLNARAASVAAEMHDASHYEFRKNLLAYFADKGTSPLISGHYPFNHEFYDKHQDDWKYMTILRHPLERWYSEYFWNRYKDHDYRKTELTLEEYIESDEGRVDTRCFVNFFARTKDDIHCLPSSVDVDSALETLEGMSVVGLLEHMDNFQDQMRNVFGRKMLMLNRNKSPAAQGQKDRLDKDSLLHKKLMVYLQPDIEIYEKTKERLGL